MYYIVHCVLYYMVPCVLHVIVKAWFRVHYRMYPYAFPVEVLEIEHQAEGRVLYFKYQDRKQVRINSIIHD